MPTVRLSPVFNDAQITTGGLPLSGGKLYTYIAGTTTPQATYTTSAGTTAQDNPIILNGRGEVANPVWLIQGSTYKIVLKDADDSTIRTIDNVQGVSDGSDSDPDFDALLVTPAYLSATQFRIASADYTATFTPGRRVRAQVTAGTIYGTVTSSTYSTDTDVTVAWDGTQMDSGLSAVWYSILSNYQNVLTAAGLENLVSNGSLTSSVSANALTVRLKTVSGNDPSANEPVLIAFFGNGATAVRRVTAAKSVVLSAGSTLGAANSQYCRIHVLALENGTDVELALYHAGNIPTSGKNLPRPFDERQLLTTTAEGGAGAADTLQTAYSTTARSAVRYRWIGYIELQTGSTAGNWSNTPTDSVIWTPSVPRVGDIVNRSSFVSDTLQSAITTSYVTLTTFNTTIVIGSNYNMLRTQFTALALVTRVTGTAPFIGYLKPFDVTAAADMFGTASNAAIIAGSNDGAGGNPSYQFFAAASAGSRTFSWQGKVNDATNTDLSCYYSNILAEELFC